MGTNEQEEGTMQPLLKVAAAKDNEATAFPVWFIIDPRELNSKAESEHYALVVVASMFTGPFFSRQAAEEELKATAYNYSSRAAVFCFPFISGVTGREKAGPRPQK